MQAVLQSLVNGFSKAITVVRYRVWRDENKEQTLNNKIIYLDASCEQRASSNKLNAKERTACLTSFKKSEISFKK
jgi:hypothetical protein